MTVEELIARIGTASVAGDWRQVQPLVVELKRLMREHGRPLHAHAAAHLVEALAAGPELSAAMSGGAEAAALVREIRKQLEQKDVDRSALMASWDALYALLADPTARVERSDISALLAALKSAREFELMAKISDRALTTLGDDAHLRSLYGQALIDSKHVLAGLDVLEAGMALPGVEGTADATELIGLVGRGNKQLYVDYVPSASAPLSVRSRMKGRLAKAIGSYGRLYDVSQPQRNYWHGINLVALMLLARQDGHGDLARIEGPQPGEMLPPEELARRIAERLEPTAAGSDDHWLLATLGECFVAREEWDKAADYLGRYVRHKKTDTFALASTIRQLEQVYRLKAGRGPGGNILAIMKEAQINKADARFTLDGDSLQQLGAFANGREHGRLLETMVPGGDFVKLQLLQKVVARASAVVALCDLNGATRGTGFLVRGGDLRTGWGDDLVIVTNAHVLSDPRLKDHEEQAPLQPGACRAVLEGAGGVPLDVGDRALWQSSSTRFDCAILPVTRRPAAVAPLEICHPETRLRSAAADGKGNLSGGSKVSVIGYPLGGPLSLSVVGTIGGANGMVVDIGARKKDIKDPVYLHYRAPTEPGNSGSPVFETDGWTVVALHHAGFDMFEGRDRLDEKPGKSHANEGVSIHSIRRALKQA